MNQWHEPQDKPQTPNSVASCWELTLKKINRGLIFLLVSGIASLTTLHSQVQWSLNRCISFAIENNTGLQRFSIQESMMREDLNQTKRSVLPGVSANSQVGMNYGRSIDPNTNFIVNTGFFNNNYSLSASVTLFEGFKWHHQLKYARSREKMSELNRLSSTDDLAFAVMNAWFDVIYYLDMLKIADEQVEASRIALRKVEKQEELGLKSKPDLYEVIANLESEELIRIQMENNLRRSRLELHQCMNYTGEEEIVPEVVSLPVIESSLFETDTLFNNFISWSPRYQSFIAQLNASRALLDKSRSQLYPSLSAFGSTGSGFYETNKNEAGRTINFSIQFKNNRNHYLGASLHIPIFSRWATRSAISKSKLEVEEAQAVLNEEEQRLYFEMAGNLNELKALEKEYSQYIKQKDANQLAFQAVEKKFENGLVSVVDYYLSKNRLASSVSQALRTRLQLEIKRRTLDFYDGKRFWEE